MRASRFTVTIVNGYVLRSTDFLAPVSARLDIAVDYSQWDHPFVGKIFRHPPLLQVFKSRGGCLVVRVFINPFTKCKHFPGNLKLQICLAPYMEGETNRAALGVPGGGGHAHGSPSPAPTLTR